MGRVSLCFYSDERRLISNLHDLLSLFIRRVFLGSEATTLVSSPLLSSSSQSYVYYSLFIAIPLSLCQWSIESVQSIVCPCRILWSAPSDSPPHFWWHLVRRIYLSKRRGHCCLNSSLPLLVLPCRFLSKLSMCNQSLSSLLSSIQFHCPIVHVTYPTSLLQP